MKKIISYLIFAALLFNSPFTFSQSGKKEAIAAAVSNYFTLERESIHAHFTKSLYLTSEKIWFKGYVFNRKLGVPFFNTTNVFAVLMDEKGAVIDTKLLYCNLSTFKGSFKLGSKIASGRYYIQFYTNWMNNFAEDESAVYEFTVINPEKGAANALAKADPSKINIELYPEGGNLVSDITNTVGIYVSDCNHEPMPVTTATVTDASGKNPITVQLTKQGYGRFILPGGIAQGSKAIVTYNGKQYEQALPALLPSGIALEVNNYTIPDKTIVNIKAGKAWLTANGNRPLYLLLHKDGEMHVYDINLNSSSEQKIVLANTDLSTGTNTIRILDSDLNQIAERLVYKYTGDPLYTSIEQTTMGYGGNGLNGKINKQGMNLSISVLPEKTRGAVETDDLYSAFLILPYIQGHKKIIGKGYFNLPARPRAYETDLFMLCQKSKYDWNNIKNNPPKDTNPFDTGITIKGKLPQHLMPVKDISFVRLFCGYPIIDQSIELKTNGEYAFENMIITDSSFVKLSKMYKAENPKEFFDVPVVVNGNRPFNKVYKPQPHCFIAGANNDIAGLPDVLTKAIKLDEVVIDAKKLRYANITGNSALRAFKITDDEVKSYRTLYNFLAFNSFFQVADVDGSVIIQSRSKSSFGGGQPTPLLYVDNMLMMDYDIVRTIYMEDIDEIYMDARAIVPSVRNNEGIIKVYLKRDVRLKKQSGANKVLIRNGFENIDTFENVSYGSTSDDGFANFGLIGWEPFIVSDAEGNFNFKIPVTDQKTVRILIEGFAADGTLISDIKTIKVK